MLKVKYLIKRSHFSTRRNIVWVYNSERPLERFRGRETVVWFSERYNLFFFFFYKLNAIHCFRAAVQGLIEKIGSNYSECWKIYFHSSFHSLELRDDWQNCISNFGTLSMISIFSLNRRFQDRFPFIAHFLYSSNRLNKSRDSSPPIFFVN